MKNHLPTIFAMMAVFALGAVSRAQTFNTLYNFTGSTDGGTPYAGVLLVDGKLYGTTYQGGAEDDGAVYELAGGTETPIYSFTGPPDGQLPRAPVIRDSQGNLYGTTWAGGNPDNDGAVFEINGTGSESVLYGFAGGTSDGCEPNAGLVEYKGDLYGTTVHCGASGFGIIFKVTKKGKETVLHTFAGGASDGEYPSYAGLTVDKDGTFYGVAYGGGTRNYGVVYKMTVSRQGKAKFSLLHSFAGGSDGCYPFGTPTLDKTGNLYGTTQTCGASNYGTIWKLVPTGKDRETMLHSFAGPPSDGEYPISGVALDAKNHIYGVTQLGGANSYGAVYKLSGRTLTLLHSFNNSDGAYPVGQVCLNSGGTVYGTTFQAGTGGYGTVWSITP